MRPSWIRFVMGGLAEAGWTTWAEQADVLVWWAPLPQVVQAAWVVERACDLLPGAWSCESLAWRLRRWRWRWRWRLPLTTPRTGGFWLRTRRLRRGLRRARLSLLGRRRLGWRRGDSAVLLAGLRTVDSWSRLRLRNIARNAVRDEFCVAHRVTFGGGGGGGGGALPMVGELGLGSGFWSGLGGGFWEKWRGSDVIPLF